MKHASSACPTTHDLDRLQKGVVIDGQKTGPAEVKALGPGHLRVTVREGRNRQVRKMCDAIGHPVTNLTPRGDRPDSGCQTEARSLAGDERGGGEEAAGGDRIQRAGAPTKTDTTDNAAQGHKKLHAQRTRERHRSRNNAFIRHERTDFEAKAPSDRSSVSSVVSVLCVNRCGAFSAPSRSAALAARPGSGSSSGSNPHSASARRAAAARSPSASAMSSTFGNS